MTARESLAADLRALRAERGISLAELARATGISSSFLSLIELAHSDLTVSRLVRLASFYDVNPADLLAPTPRPPRGHALILRAVDDRVLDCDAEGVNMFDLAAGGDWAFSPMVSIVNPGEVIEIEDDPAREIMIFALDGTFGVAFDDDEPITIRRGEGTLFHDVTKCRITSTGRRPGRLLSVGVSLQAGSTTH